MRHLSIRAEKIPGSVFCGKLQGNGILKEENSNKKFGIQVIKDMGYLGIWHMQTRIAFIYAKQTSLDSHYSRKGTKRIKDSEVESVGS